MKTEKKTVRLGRIKPNQNNPRREFGDIEALADAIRATGGAPVNPIVVVEDEDAFIIIDGERRYRALSTMYDADHEVEVLVADDYSAAAELVAMLATDDKLTLTEGERSQGFQLGLVLGVPDEPLAQATHTDVESVKGARRVWRALNDDDREKYRQATIDQLAKAAEFEGKDRETILAADPGWWQGKAANIELRIKKQALIDAMMDKVAELGLEWRNKISDDEALWRSGSFFYSLDMAPSDAADKLAEKITETGATVVVRDAGMGPWGMELCVPRTEGESPEEAKRREKKALRERKEAARKSLKKRVIMYVFKEGIYMSLNSLVVENRKRDYSYASIEEEFNKLKLEDDLVEGYLASVSAYEVMKYLNNLAADDYWQSRSLDWPKAIVAALEPYGFVSTDEDKWLIETTCKAGQDA